MTRSRTPASASEGHRLAEGLRRIGQIYQAPQANFLPRGDRSGPAVDMAGLMGFLGAGLDGGLDGGLSAATGPEADAGLDRVPLRLPGVAGGSTDGAWRSLPPIAPRDSSACAGGLRDLGVLLVVHDVEDKRVAYAENGDADAWVAVHDVSDLVAAVRAHVGRCGRLQGLMISAHGGSTTGGGFRMGRDTDGDGRIEAHADGTFEAHDLCTGAGDARLLGTILAGAIAAEGFIAVESCSSAGQGNVFVTALAAGSGRRAIGTGGSANVGGNLVLGGWWTAPAGRVLAEPDGTIRSSADRFGTGVWRSF